MYRIASTIIHFKYFEHLRLLNVANFFFWYSIVQNHVWPSLLGSQDRTRCDEPPSQKLPNYWRDPHQASTSIQKWRSKSRRPDIYRPILRNILKHLQLPILFWLSSVEHSENQTNDCDQLQFALQSEWSWWKWLQRKYLSHTDHTATFSYIFQAGYGCNKELPWWANKGYL